MCNYIIISRVGLALSVCVYEYMIYIKIVNAWNRMYKLSLLFDNFNKKIWILVTGLL